MARLVPILCLLAPLLIALGCDDATPPNSPDTGVETDAGNGVDAGGTDTTTGTDVCVPACGEAECGPDGCGGTCGTCGGGQSCSGGMCRGGLVASCPAEGAGGMAVGDVVPDLTLTDTDGVEHSLRASCEKTTWVFNFSGWCPPCRDFALGPANDLYDAFSTDEVQSFFVVSQDDGFAPASMEFCQVVKERYNLRMPVLCDTEGVLVRELGATPNSYSVVLNRGSTIHWRAQFREASLPAQVRDSLAL